MDSTSGGGGGGGGGGVSEPSSGEGPSVAGGGGAEGSSAAPPSRYESQKRRDWNTFLQYLKNHKPPLSLARCSGAHVIEFLKYLDQFGKTKVHLSGCAYFGHPNPPAPCACPLKQAWGSLDALIGRLRAAYEENGGRPESNPFGARAVRIYLREVREGQAKARGIPYEKKKRKRPTTAAVANASTAAAVTQGVADGGAGGSSSGGGGSSEAGAASVAPSTTPLCPQNGKHQRRGDGFPDSQPEGMHVTCFQTDNHNQEFPVFQMQVLLGFQIVKSKAHGKAKFASLRGSLLFSRNQKRGLAHH